MLAYPKTNTRRGQTYCRFRLCKNRLFGENRKAYFYIDENGNMFVRAGCWFSGMQAFKNRVKEVHAGTIHEKTYLAACDLAELMLKGE